MYSNNVFKIDINKHHDLSSHLPCRENDHSNSSYSTQFKLSKNYEPTEKIIVNSDTTYKLCNNLSYVYLDPNVTSLLGYNANEVMEYGLKPFILEVRTIDDKQITNISLEKLPFLRQNLNMDLNRWEADYLIKKKDGNLIWVSDVAYPWLNKQGQLIGTTGCLRDITNRVNAENFYKQELLKQAYTDSLTTLANRRYFFEHLEIEMKRRQRNPRDLSILLIDLDYFKQINDKYGHYVGDQILQRVAEKIRHCTRETDLAARLGGEEFGVYLPDTSLLGAYEVAQRLRMLINEFRLKLVEYKSAISCTVSIGVASTSAQKSVAVSELYKLADKRLYMAKSTGRNKVSADDCKYYIN